MKKQLLCTLVAVAALAVMLVASRAQASVKGDTISIKFGADQPSPGGSALDPNAVAGVPGVESANWNNASDAQGTISNLVRDTLSTSAPSGASGSWFCTDTWSAGGNDNFGSDDYKLMNGYLDQNEVPSVITISITNLPDDMAASYDVYVYFLGDSVRRGGVYTVNGVSKFGFVCVDCTGPGYMDAGQVVPPAKGNYLVFQGLSGNTVSITSDNDIDFRSPINAIQVVATPQLGRWCSGPKS